MSVWRKDWVSEMMGNSHVIRRWVRAKPDALDDNIAIHFMHIF